MTSLILLKEIAHLNLCVFVGILVSLPQDSPPPRFHGAERHSGSLFCTQQPVARHMTLAASCHSMKDVFKDDAFRDECVQTL